MITLSMLTKGGMSQDSAEPYERAGPREGPGDPLAPGGHGPQDYQRGYIHEGHAAPSPGQDPPHSFPVMPPGRGLVDVDLSAAGARGMLVRPMAPGGPGDCR